MARFVYFSPQEKETAINADISVGLTNGAGENKNDGRTG